MGPLEEDPLNLVLKQHFVISVTPSLFITAKCCKCGDTARMLTDEQCHGCCKTPAVLCMLIDNMTSDKPQACCWPVLSGTSANTNWSAELTPCSVFASSTLTWKRGIRGGWPRLWWGPHTRSDRSIAPEGRTHPRRGWPWGSLWGYHARTRLTGCWCCSSAHRSLCLASYRIMSCLIVSTCIRQSVVCWCPAVVRATRDRHDCCRGMQSGFADQVC